VLYQNKHNIVNVTSIIRQDNITYLHANRSLKRPTTPKASGQILGDVRLGLLFI
jgi:hypothetical protein